MALHVKQLSEPLKKFFSYLSGNNPLVVSGVVGGAFIITLFYFFNMLPEIPSLITNIKLFFSDISIINSYFERVFERLDIAIEKIGQKQDKAFSQYGLLFANILTLITSAYSNLLNMVFNLTSQLITFADKNPVFSAVALVLMITLTGGIISGFLYFTGKTLSGLAQVLKCIGLCASFISGGVTGFFSRGEGASSSRGNSSQGPVSGNNREVQENGNRENPSPERDPLRIQNPERAPLMIESPERLGAESSALERFSNRLIEVSKQLDIFYIPWKSLFWRKNHDGMIAEMLRKNDYKLNHLDDVMKRIDRLISKEMDVVQRKLDTLPNRTYVENKLTNGFTEIKLLVPQSSSSTRDILEKLIYSIGEKVSDNSNLILRELTGNHSNLERYLNDRYAQMIRICESSAHTNGLVRGINDNLGPLSVSIHKDTLDVQNLVKESTVNILQGLQLIYRNPNDLNLPSSSNNSVVSQNSGLIEETYIDDPYKDLTEVDPSVPSSSTPLAIGWTE